MPSRADSCIRGRVARTIASASSSETSPVRRHGSMPGREAALGLPQVADPGDHPLVEQRVADRARRVVLAQPPEERGLVELGREDVRAELREAPVEAGAGGGHQLEHRAVDLRHDLARRGGSPATRCAGSGSRRRGRATCRSSAGASGSRSPPSKRRNRCLPCASTPVTAWPGQLLRPAVAAEARVRRLDRVRARGPPARAGSCSPRSGWCRPPASLRVWSAARRCVPEPAPMKVRLRGFPGELAVT